MKKKNKNFSFLFYLFMGGGSKKGNIPLIKRLPKKKAPPMKRKRGDVEKFDLMDIQEGNNSQIASHTHLHRKKTKEDKSDVCSIIHLRQKVDHKKSIYFMEQL